MKKSFFRGTLARMAGLLLVLLAGGGAAVRGQSALDGFDPKANNVIDVIVVQPDGKILIGGAFTTLSPNGGPTVTRNRIARLNPDGTLDAAFDPNANNEVRSIAVQADGKILVGGFFNGTNSIGGQSRSRFARLDSTTGAADSFDPSANGAVFAITVQPDGKILVGGSFTAIGGQTRNRIARLDPATGLADSFNPNANGVVFAITAQVDGKILVGGFFNGVGSIGGQTRNRIARLDATGLADSFNPNANSNVSSIAMQADGKVLAGGTFSGANSIGGATRNRIARLDGTTGLADSFDPNADGEISAVKPQSDGKILVGGFFSSIGGQLRNKIARLDPATGLADSFDPNASNDVFSIAVQADGKILSGGAFFTLAPNGGATMTRQYIARLEIDGRLDQNLGSNVVNNRVFISAVQPDGKILLVGDFSMVLGVPRNRIARLNTDGTLDMAFDANLSNGEIYSLALQPDGKVLAGGTFSGANSIGGQNRNRIARLDGTTGSADSFNPNVNGEVFSIAIQADEKVLIAGNFTFAGGESRNYIARLDATSGVADSFDPNANNALYSVATQGDGKILAGGFFTNIGGQARNHIARLDATTGLADTFDPNANGVVQSITVQPDGNILVSGDFNGANSIGGQTRNYLARLEAATGLADSFNPNPSSLVFGISLQADGKILMAGYFGSIGGQVRNHIARLDPMTGLADSYNPNASSDIFSMALTADGEIVAGGSFGLVGGQSRFFLARITNDAAFQDLLVTRGSVTWMRGGSSPQFTRVSFDYSPDNLNFTPLGNGTVNGSNWTLTGVSLPIGQNLYVRARGYYRCGIRNNSGSIVETVRNAFIGPLQLATASSRKTHGSAGDFDISLPLIGESGVECRSSGGAHTLVFFFSNNVVSGNASVTGGMGTVAGSPAFTANTMTVNLTGVTDVQQISVTVSGVTDSFGQVLPSTAVAMNILAGDTSGNKTVNASDLAQTKAQSGVPITSANFREDVTPNGTINASDVGLVKSRSGQSLP